MLTLVLTVRDAGPDDMDAVERVRIATWKVAYRGIVPDDHLDALTVSPDRVADLRARYGGPVRTLLAELGGDPVGMAAVGPCRDDDRAGATELYALYVLPSGWGVGVGQELWDAAQPFTSLWVLAGNTRARAFYERNGFRPDVTKDVVVGTTLSEVRYLFGPDRPPDQP